jgi:hypothetical protein
VEVRVGNAKGSTVTGEKIFLCPSCIEGVRLFKTRDSFECLIEMVSDLISPGKRPGTEGG